MAADNDLAEAKERFDLAKLAYDEVLDVTSTRTTRWAAFSQPLRS